MQILQPLERVTDARKSPFAITSMSRHRRGVLLINQMGRDIGIRYGRFSIQIATNWWLGHRTYVCGYYANQISL